MGAGLNPAQATGPRPRLLYLVGGVGNAERVDVSDLFAERLGRHRFAIDWVVYAAEPGPAWQRTCWRGAPACIVGRAPVSPRGRGLGAAMRDKLREIGADLRTAGLILRGDYDLVQVRDKFVVAVLALLACRWRGCQFVYWMSYPFAECRIQDAREGRARWPWLSRVGGRLAAWLLYRVILPGADHVFVQSEQMQRDVAAEGIPLARMTPVPMGVSPRLLELAPLSPEPGTLLYLGTLTRVRRLDMLLDALQLVRRQHPAARLILVGEGDMPGDRAALERAVQVRGLGAAVEFTGQLPMADAWMRVRRAAVCLSPFYPTPILNSTSPTKLVEYLALGRPVVGNRHPEQGQILADSGAGLCVEWSASAFAGACVELLADPVAAEAMGRRGPPWVRRHRLYDRIAADLERVYEYVLPGERAAGGGAGACGG